MQPIAFADRTYSAFLFDMDGTLLTSLMAAERVWSSWARRHGLDVVSFLPTMHGKRTHDTISQLNLPGVDPVAESAWITAAEIEDVVDVTAIAGAANFLASLPPECWGIVTSAPRKLAEARLAAAGLPVDHLLVAAEDVEFGKPEPDPFLLGAHKLQVLPANCLVFEDTMAGLQSAASAGMDSIVVTLTHTHSMDTAIPSILDYAALEAYAGRGGLRVRRRMEKASDNDCI